MIKQILRELLESINNNRGKFFGALVGFLVAVLILIIGFLKTLFIFLCTCIGYIIGSKSYKKIDFREILEKILPLGGRS